MTGKNISEDHLPEIEKVKSFAETAYEWAGKNVLTWDSLQQIVVIAALAVFSWGVARKAANFLQKKGDTGSRPVRILKGLRLPPDELAFIVLFPLLLWIVSPLAVMAKAYNGLITVAAMDYCGTEHSQLAGACS